jgi:acyl carrier protein
MALSRDGLIDYINDKLGLDRSEFSDDTLLFSTSMLDSFSMVDLILYIEQAAGVTIDPGSVTLDNLDSVERILAFVGSQQA